MKNPAKLTGIIAILAIIGFFLAGCDTGANGDGTAPIPSAPTDVTATAQSYGVRAKNSYGAGPAGTGYNSTPVPLATPSMDTISWGSGAQTLNILINPVTHATEYIIYYSESASGSYLVLDTVDSDTMLAGKVNFTSYFPAPRGSTFYFKVAAVFETAYTPSRVVSNQSSYKSYKLP
jgi:hypothetical protein